jgi:4-diphosphocytidyl-2-C-methyl-D-erythritol kinase
MRVRAHAKVNLWLRVLGRRPDGYHQIETVFHGIDLADDIEVTTTEGDSTVVEMSLTAGIKGDVPAPEANLAHLAAERLARRAGTARGARIRITKGIPLGAGLGGGSADAAGVLVALNELWETGLRNADLRALGGDIGSDVPFLLNGGTAMGSGRGETLSPIPAEGALWFVLGISVGALSTGDVYGRWSHTGAAVQTRASDMIEAIQSGDAERVAALLHNDLATPARDLRPELHDAVPVMVDAGALGACISGSGPTVFGIARDEVHARHIATALAGRYDAVRIARSAPRSIEIVERHYS